VSRNTDELTLVFKGGIKERKFFAKYFIEANNCRNMIHEHFEKD